MTKKTMYLDAQGSIGWLSAALEWPDLAVGKPELIQKNHANLQTLAKTIERLEAVRVAAHALVMNEMVEVHEYYDRQDGTKFTVIPAEDALKKALKDCEAEE